MKKIIVLITILCTFSVMSQKKVLNPKFNTMLDTLLAHNVKEILPLEIKNKNDILFLDAREKKEYTTSHIKDALWIGFTSFNAKKLKDINKNKKIVVYCTVGYRSEIITQKLTSAGFTNVLNLYGGIFEWAHNNLPIVNKKGITTEIHTYNKVWSQWLDTGIKKY